MKRCERLTVKIEINNINVSRGMLAEPHSLGVFETVAGAAGDVGGAANNGRGGDGVRGSWLGAVGADGAVSWALETAVLSRQTEANKALWAPRALIKWSRQRSSGESALDTLGSRLY